MVNAKIVVVGSALAVFATALLTALILLNMNGQNGFYLEADTPDGGKLYLKADANGINYDVAESRTAPDGVTYQAVDRFFSVAGSAPVLASTFAKDGIYAGGNYIGSKANENMWQLRQVPGAAEHDVSVTKNGNNWVVTVSGHVETIEMTASGVVTSFAGMPVTRWSTNPSDYDSRPTANIPNPTSSNTMPIQASGDAVSGSLRRNLNSQANSGSRYCAAKLSSDVYGFGGNKGNVISCDGLNTVGFQGTNPAEMQDVADDLIAVYDNFYSGWSHVEWGTNGVNQGTSYQLCTGHSLGGAIAKYNTLQGKCGQTITFGAPVTANHPGNIPLLN